MKKIYSLLFLLCCTCVFAQNENNNWFFGDYAGVSFAGPVPVAQPGTSNVATLEGCASVSNGDGEYLFSTNGRKVWNKNHEIMTNGTSLTADGATDSQGVVIVPLIGNRNIYYVFTTNGGPDYNPNNMHAYSIVDMTLNNGLGDVSSLNNPLYIDNTNYTVNTNYEAITSIEYNSGYWVVIPYLNKLLAYRVTDDGVNPFPVTSYFDHVVDQAIVQVKISPDGKVLALTEFNSDTCKLYYFDINTGTIANQNAFRTFTMNSNDIFSKRIYSAEFSEKSNNIWFSMYDASSKIYGYDIYNAATPPVVYDGPGNYFGTLQLAKDYNIYVSRYGKTYLASIQNPDILSSATFTLDAVSLNGKLGRLGLPQKVTKPCVWEKILTSPEERYEYIYEVSSHIITQDNYVTEPDQKITLSAANYVLLTPNTTIQGTFLAEIGGCGGYSGTTTAERKGVQDFDGKTVVTYLEPGNEKVTVSISPNPTSGIATVYADTEIKNIQMANALGTIVSRFENQEGNTATINLTGLSEGIYYLTIETVKGTQYSKVIKR